MPLIRTINAKLKDLTLAFYYDHIYYDSLIYCAWRINAMSGCQLLTACTVHKWQLKVTSESKRFSWCKLKDVEACLPILYKKMYVVKFVMVANLHHFNQLFTLSPFWSIMGCFVWQAHCHCSMVHYQLLHQSATTGAAKEIVVLSVCTNWLQFTSAHLRSGGMPCRNG